MKKTLLLLLSLGFFSGILFSQDVDYSQFYNNPTYYNPANVGLTKGFKARLNYRNQWVNIPGDFKSYSFTADIADRDLPGAGGLGIIFNEHNEGVGYMKSTTAGVMPSVRIQIARTILMQAGALISIVQKTVNYDNLVFSDEIDNRYGQVYPGSFKAPNNNSVSFADFAFGLTFQVHGEKAIGTFGAATHHLTTPNQSFFEISVPLSRKYVAHADVIFNVKEYKGYFKKKASFKLNPGLFYQHQASLNVYGLGMNVYFTNMYLGAWYKNEKVDYNTYSNLSFMLGIKVPFTENNKMKVMYSYDLAISSNQSFVGPTHEFTILIELDDLKLIPSSSRFPRYTGRQYPQEPLECAPF